MIRYILQCSFYSPFNIPRLRHAFFKSKIPDIINIWLRPNVNTPYTEEITQSGWKNPFAILGTKNLHFQYNTNPIKIQGFSKSDFTLYKYKRIFLGKRRKFCEFF